MVHFYPPPRLLSIDYAILEVTPQSSYSCLTAYHAPQVSSFLKRELPDLKSIIDGTAHIGCDVLNFAITYPRAHITAIEIDSKATSCLKQNIKAFFRFEYQQQRFTVINCDVVDFLKGNREIGRSLTDFSFPVDLIYLDIPWGGPDYYKKQRLMLFLSEIPVFTIVNEIFAHNLTTYVLLKVPKNFDVIEFTSQLAFSNWIKFFSVLKVNNRIAFTLLLIKRSP